MSWWQRLRRDDRLEDELDAELHYHFDRTVEDNITQGMSSQEARRQARVEFGGLDQVKEECRDARSTRWVRALGHDVRDASRRLARSPLFTATAVLIVALGIGANAAVFTVVNAVLFKAPPYEDPARVVFVYQNSDDGEPYGNSFPATRDMATYSDVFSGVAAMSASTITWEADDGPRQALIEYVTASYFPVLGLAPSRGQWLDPDFDLVGAGNYAVVSHRTWRTQFGADPGVIGQTIRMDGQPVTLVGGGSRGIQRQRGRACHRFLVVDLVSRHRGTLPRREPRTPPVPLVRGLGPPIARGHRSAGPGGNGCPRHSARR